MCVGIQARMKTNPPSKKIIMNYVYMYVYNVNL